MQMMTMKSPKSCCGPSMPDHHPRLPLDVVTLKFSVQSGQRRGSVRRVLVIWLVPQSTQGHVWQVVADVHSL